MTSQIKSSAFLLWIITLSLVLSNSTARYVRAQVEQTKPADAKEKEAAEQKELRQKQFALLNDVASGAWGLKVAENRVFIMSGAADLLWDFDEKRARGVYWDAINALNSLSVPAGVNAKKLSEDERNKVVQNYYAVYELRRKLLRQVAQKDAQLALDLMHTSRQARPQNIGSDFQFPADRDLEQEIASQLAARDPAQALQIARQSLAKGIGFETFTVLQRLNEKDPEKASQFAGEVIAKLRTANLANDFTTSIIAILMLEASRPRDSNQQTRLSGISSGSSVSESPLNLSDEQKRALVEALTDAALTTAYNPHVISRFSSVLPEIEQFFPERHAQVAAKIAAVSRSRDSGLQNQVTPSSRAPFPPTVEEMVNADSEDSATPILRYQQAAVMAVVQGKTDWFREAMEKKPLNEKERAQVLDLLDTTELSMLEDSNTVERLQKLAPKIRRNELRAAAMGQLALKLHQNGKTEEAVSVLDEAATLIKSDLRDPIQTDAYLTLLCAYAIVDPAKAFAMAERTIDRANSQISLLTLVDKVIKTGALKKGELLLEQPQLMSLEILLFKYGKGVNALAKADFNRTRALAERFDRNELRLMAQLVVLRAMLKPETLSGSRLSLMRM